MKARTCRWCAASTTAQGGYGSMNFLEGLLDLEDARLQDMDANRRRHAAAVADRPGRADVRCRHGLRAGDARQRPARRSHRPASDPLRGAGDLRAAVRPSGRRRRWSAPSRKLKLNGFILNSHTNSEYFDDPKYWPILEAAEALNRLHLHPSARRVRRSQGAAERLRHGFGDVGLRRGGRHACRAHDGLGAVRSISRS